MTKKELEIKLNEALDSYLADRGCVASDPYSKRPITEGELYEASRQTFDALYAFKQAILEYLP